MTVPALIVLMPSRTEPQPETQLALASNMDGFPFVLRTIVGHHVILHHGSNARDLLWQQARDMARENPSGAQELFVLLLDDDMWWPQGTIRKMVSIMDRRPDVEIVSHTCGPRRPFSHALGDQYVTAETREQRLVEIRPRQDADGLIQKYFPFLCLCMCRAAVLEKIHNPDHPFSVPDEDVPATFGANDDSLFARNVSWGDMRAWTLYDLTVAHCERGYAFLPYEPPGRIVDNRWALAEEFSGCGREEIVKRFQQERRGY